MSCNKVLWNSLLATPALIGAALIVSSSAIAAEAQPSTKAGALLGDVTSLQINSVAAPTVAPVQISAMPAPEAAPVAEFAPNASIDALAGIAPIAPAPAQIAQTAAPAPAVEAAPVAAPSVEATPAAAPSVDSLNQVVQYGNEGNNGLAQSGGLTIDRLSDVSPNDWAFTALQSLVEKYACIVGYPDLTYRGNRALTRYEFAAGLNSCLDRISDLIAASTADLATKEDLATLQRLQEEFAAELATLRGRVDSLEARTAELEANQFSTTTKLKGETIFLVAVPFEGEEFNDQPLAGYRVRLNFDTSFTGDDLLRARLQSRNIDNLAGFGDLNWQIGSGADSTVELSKLYYTFPLGNSVDVTIAANGYSDSDWVASSITPFDNDGGGGISNFSTAAAYKFLPGSAGAGAIIQLSDNFSFDFGYSAAEAQRSTPGAGLFNGDYGIIAQLTYLSDGFDAALVYGNGYSGTGFTNGGSGGPAVANTYGALVNFKFGDFEVGANGAYVPIIDIGNSSYSVWSYQATLAIRDLGGKGNMLGLLAGVAPYDSDLSFGLDDDNSFTAELFYRLQLSDNISVTPGVIYVGSPDNNSNNGSTVVGAVRTTFSF
jgi:Carbohydrate-selective porin, OprB family/S-layer homology domain